MVFRGQYLTFQELEHLKNNIKSIMITNTFCSATLNEKVAHFFISDGQKPPPGQMAVIFQIIIDDLYYDYIPLNLHNIRPFAYIASQSQIKDEKEVLFAFGSAFQIKEVISPNEEKRWWTVILSLESFYAARCSPDMREIFRFRPSFTPLIEEFAKFCHYVTENREMLLSAEWYGFTRPHIESLLKSGYNAMTESFLHNEKYAKGIDAMQRLLMLQTRLSSSTDISLVSTYCKLVVIYEKNNQYNESIHTFKDKVLPLLMSRDPDGKDYMNAASKECLPNGISFQDVCTSLSNAYESIGTSSMALLWRKLRKHMKPLAGTLADQQRRSLVSYRIETSEQMTDNDKLELYEKYLHNTLNSYKSSDHPMKNSIDKDDAEIFTDLVWSICGLKGCLRLYCYDIPVLEYASNSADIVSLSIHNTTTLIIGNIPSPIIQQTIMPSAPLPFHSYYHRFFADDIVHTSNAFEYATRLIHFSNDILIKLDFQSKIEPNLGSDPLIHQHVLFLRYFIHIQCDDTKEFLMDKQQSNHLEALNRRILTDFHLLNHETFVPSLAGLAFVGSSINDTATENENGSPVENVASLLFKLQWHIGLIVAYFYACNTEEKNDIQIKLLNIERRLLRFWICNIEKKIIQTSNIYDKILKNRFTDQLEIGSYLNHRPSTHDFQFKAKDTIQCSGLPSIFKDILKILYELQEDDRLLHNLFDKWKQKESVDHDSSLQFEEETRKNLSTIVSLQSLIKYLIDYRIKVINTDQNDEFDRFITWYHACPPLEHMYNTIQTTEIMYHKARDYVEKTFLSYKQQIN
ncbi:unnamed protein product [Adineta steineri]|uniref:Uncharacterized protein n=1 Tax=Adineta steineri TaxID=433720 RepID=A0A816A1P4_9BILA|nr:unnamed protein product [Adineta steineri]CAF1590842.1 unnamed protein product [Adineta steineri]